MECPTSPAVIADGGTFFSSASRQLAGEWMGCIETKLFGGRSPFSLLCGLCCFTGKATFDRATDRAAYATQDAAEHGTVLGLLHTLVKATAAEQTRKAALACTYKRGPCHPAAERRRDLWDLGRCSGSQPLRASTKTE